MSRYGTVQLEVRQATDDFARWCDVLFGEHLPRRTSSLTQPELTMKTSLLLTLLSTSILNLGCGSEADPPAHELGLLTQDLYGMGNIANPWPNGRVPICWAQGSGAHLDWQARIAEILADTWSKYATIDFVDVGDCSRAPAHRVRVDFSGPVKDANGVLDHFRGVADDLGAGAREVTLMNFDAAASERFRYEVIHEFGHVLGFVHEQQRPDNWTDGEAERCPSPSVDENANHEPIADGTYYTSFYDQDSIMAYCMPDWAQNLSSGDIASAASAYPPLKPAGVVEDGQSAAWTPNGNALYIVARGENGRVYEKHWTAQGGYSQWYDLGGQTLGVPSVAWTPDGHAMYIVVRGTDNQVYEKHWTASAGYSDFHRIGNVQILSSPSVAWTRDGHAMYIAVRGADSVLRESHWTAAAGYSDWYSLGERMNASPSIAWTPQGHAMYIAIRDQQDALAEMHWTASAGYSKPFSLGGHLSSSPSAVWTPSGAALYLVVRGSDNQIYEKHWTAAGGYSEFFNLGGSFATSPSAVWTPDGGALYIVGRGTDGKTYEKHWTAAAGYSAWNLIGDRI